jgi:hypothetical protein
MSQNGPAYRAPDTGDNLTALLRVTARQAG